MAIFLLKARQGGRYTPPACVTPIFADVPCSNPLAPWINELVARGSHRRLRRRQLLPGLLGDPRPDGGLPAGDSAGRWLSAAGLHRSPVLRRALLQPLRALGQRAREARHHRRLRRRHLLPQQRGQPGPDGGLPRHELRAAPAAGALSPSQPRQGRHSPSPGRKPWARGPVWHSECRPWRGSGEGWVSHHPRARALGWRNAAPDGAGLGGPPNLTKSRTRIPTLSRAPYAPPHHLPRPPPRLPHRRLLAGRRTTWCGR